VSEPVVVRTRDDLAKARADLPGPVAVVMTMGALHEGHAMLVRRARERAAAVIVTIFLNPLQFSPGEDLAKYPRTFDEDLRMCSEEGVDLVFAPGPDVVYPDGDPGVRVSAGRLGDILEGASRPGHFDGVLTVVAKLLHQTRSDLAYFGQKDAQQLLLIRRMVRDLDFDVEVVSVPTVRDADGLALSSRNAYLRPAQRAQALAIPAGLAAAARRFAAGERDAACLGAAVSERLALAADLLPEYVDVVDGASFAPVAAAARGSKIVVAAKIDGVRLIDTHTQGVDEPPATPRGALDTTDAHGLEPGVAERSRPCTVP